MNEIKQNELLNIYGLDELLKNGNIKMLRHQGMMWLHLFILRTFSNSELKYQYE